MKLPQIFLRASWMIGVFALWAAFLVVVWRAGVMNEAIDYVRVAFSP